MLKITAEGFLLSIEYFGRIGVLYKDSEPYVDQCSDDIKKNCLGSIRDTEEFISGFRAPATVSAMKRLKAMCEKEEAYLHEVAALSFQVFDRFRSEVGGQWLIIVSHDHSDYLDENVAPFGNEVRDEFPKLAEDIDEAAKCLALSRYTACVFHLMRVMESTVHTLARKLKVTVDLRVATWNDITTAMSNAVNAMPGKTAIQKKNKRIYSEIIGNLNAVRIAWRNEVMHPKKTYTRPEAARIFTLVEGFLTSLLSIV